MIPREILKKIRQIEIRTNRIGHGNVLAISFIICSAFLCSCASRPHSEAIPCPRELPAEITIAPEAGRGGHLVVNLRLENGEALSILLDTGAPVTVLDKSLESELGKRRGTMPVRIAGRATEQGGVYTSPKLYLGDTLLLSGPTVATYDFKQQPMGILGMDCLKHYCVQLDFQAGKLRFLNSSNLNLAELGRAFPLTFKRNYPFIRYSNLVGEGTMLLVDVGCNIDGLVDRRTHKFDGVYLPECMWGGQTYRNLMIAAVEYANALGLRFLARHLVTFDFPRKTMYLRQTSIGPLDQDEPEVAAASPRRSALRLLNRLKDSQQLPGWTKAEKERIFFDEETSADGNAVTFRFWVSGDTDRYCYHVSRASPDDTWKLHRAWRTGQAASQLEEYPIP